MPHPLMLKYRDTEQFNFPLVLVIGREPNTTDLSDGLVGDYDFDDYPKCAFWNVAFSILARIVASTRKDIKEEFRNKRAAPLLFSDAFAQGIVNSVRNKLIIRNEQAEGAEYQIEALFKHSYLLNRVGLVILSGLDHKVYSDFKVKLYERLVGSTSVVIDLPFFYPTNMPSIMSRLTDVNKALIKEIYESFKREVENQSLLKQS